MQPLAFLYPWQNSTRFTRSSISTLFLFVCFSSSVITFWWIGWVNVITKFWLRMARFLLYIVVWFLVHGLLPVPAGMWHFGGNLQCCSPYLCPEPFISSSFELSCFCKMSAHTSEADLLFLPVKPFSFSSYLSSSRSSNSSDKNKIEEDKKVNDKNSNGSYLFSKYLKN